MAQEDQSAMGEMQDPGVMAALNAGVGLPMMEDSMADDPAIMAAQGNMPMEAQMDPTMMEQMPMNEQGGIL
jgi:hypothetical protein